MPLTERKSPGAGGGSGWERGAERSVLDYSVWEASYPSADGTEAVAPTNLKVGGFQDWRPGGASILGVQMVLEQWKCLGPLGEEKGPEHLARGPRV